MSPWQAQRAHLATVAHALGAADVEFFADDAPGGGHMMLSLEPKTTPETGEAPPEPETAA